MIPGIDPRVDYAFKKVFGTEANVPILADFLNAVLDPHPRIVELELLNPFNDKDTADDKLSILDIKARDALGQQHNVEMQMFGAEVHRHRILYYWACLHADQLNEGQKYTDLRATISIAIVNATLFPDVADYHLAFQLRSPAHPQLVFSSQQAIHLLELQKFTKAADDLANPLEEWCYFLTHAAQMDTADLPKAFTTPAVHQAMEVLTMLSQNDVERERYRARLKWERDQTAFLDEAIEKGIAKGREEGAWIGRIQMLQELLKVPVTPKQDLAALSLEELQTRAQALQEQMKAAKP